MPTIMRKISVISLCSNLFRSENSTNKIPGIYHSYISAISRHPGSSQDFLAKHLCRNKSSVTRHLTFLENEGLVQRKTSLEDKRELLVYPTEKMIELLPETRAISKKWNSLLTSQITEEELEIFNKVLDKMYLTARETIYGKEEKK